MFLLCIIVTLLKTSVEPPLYLWYDGIVNSLKQDAINLRNQGYSYNLIKAKLGVPKSTLSNWLVEIPFQPNQEVITRIRDANMTLVRKKLKDKFDTWDRIKIEAAKEVGSVEKRDLFMLGLGVYIGEGSKGFGNVKIINSDPQIINLAIRWFNQICNVPLDNFTLAIHLYPDNDVDETLKFWSNITGVPLSQFHKVQIDRRINKSKLRKKKLPYGTAHLAVKANGNPLYGVQLSRRILAWIDCATKESMRV